MSSANLELAKAFPASLKDEALQLISLLPEPNLTSQSFSIRVGPETVWIPYRIYHDPGQIDSTSISETQAKLLACLMTRHHNGFIRAENLPKVLELKHEWVPPFVLQLVGEYVIQIIASIRDSLDHLDAPIYRDFLIRNPSYYETTKRRVQSYWDCYHRGESMEGYAAFQVLYFFDGLISERP